MGCLVTMQGCPGAALAWEAKSKWELRRKSPLQHGVAPADPFAGLRAFDDERRECRKPYG